MPGDVRVAKVNGEPPSILKVLMVLLSLNLTLAVPVVVQRFALTLMLGVVARLITEPLVNVARTVLLGLISEKDDITLVLLVVCVQTPDVLQASTVQALLSSQLIAV